MDKYILYSGDCDITCECKDCGACIAWSSELTFEQLQNLVNEHEEEKHGG